MQFALSAVMSGKRRGEGRPCPRYRADRHACGASNKGLAEESIGGERAPKRLTTGRRKDKMEKPRNNEADDRAAQAKRPENNNHPGF